MELGEEYRFNLNHLSILFRIKKNSSSSDRNVNLWCIMLFYTADLLVDVEKIGVDRNRRKKVPSTKKIPNK